MDILKSQRILQAHLKTAQAITQPKFLKELAKPTQERTAKQSRTQLKKNKISE